MYQAAASGQLDVISANSTDGRIETQRLRVLDDERCVTMMAEFVAANPELWNEDIGR